MEDLIYWLSYSASQIAMFISTALLLNRNPRLFQQAQAMKVFFPFFFSCLVQVCEKSPNKAFFKEVALKIC